MRLLSEVGDLRIKVAARDGEILSLRRKLEAEKPDAPISRGDAHRKSKLTLPIAMTIKRCRDFEISPSFIASIFGIDRDTVHSIWNGRTWGMV